jgi:hypothetical protein
VTDLTHAAINAERGCLRAWVSGSPGPIINGGELKTPNSQRIQSGDTEHG